MSKYSVYLVRCCDGSLYTGIATDVARRVTEHQDSKRGARFLRGKGPLTLVYQREIGNRSLASKIESRVKRLPKAEKTNVELLSKRIGSFVAQLED
ncbi:MAG: GIY-YIG nuclease family protein [Woeseiaceae bacterium]